jgi:DNA-binding GntR family transcriptional regulator
MNIGIRDLDAAAGGTAGEDCFRAIRGDIVHGRLAPRERLRLEALRGRYGASISTLREVLNRLAGEGLVTGLGRRGFAVAPVTRAEFRELAALRALIEEHALERSFRRGDLEWEGEVVGAHHRLDRVERMMLAGETGRSDLWKQYDKAFHQVLIAACGSAALIQAHSGIFDRCLRYQIVAMVFRGAVAAEEHRALRQCALDRDAAGARAILRRHIDACVEHTVGTDALDDGPAAEPAAAAETVGHAVWKRLRGDILAGRLAPGQKLRLDALRGDYGASVSTLREVLNRLVTEELVLAEGQRGFEVAPISRADLAEIAELRLLLENHAIAEAFRTGSVEWEAQVVAAYHRLAAMEERMAAGDRSVTERWKRYDWEFHQALIAACGSPVLMQVHGQVFDKYLRYQMIALSFRGAVAAEEHRLLLEHALRRDVAAAQQVLARHLAGGLEHAQRAGCV